MSTAQPPARGETDGHSGAQRHRGSVTAMPRSRGAASAVLLVALGIWGAVIPFVGPYFTYAFGTDTPWVFTVDGLWLNILPGIVVFLGGLLLGPSRNRISGGLGAWLALAGGIWFTVGPTLSQLWGGSGPADPIGEPYWVRERPGFRPPRPVGR